MKIAIWRLFPDTVTNVIRSGKLSIGDISERNTYQTCSKFEIVARSVSEICSLLCDDTNSINYGLKALLCTHMLSPYTTIARRSTVGGARRSHETNANMAAKMLNSPPLARHCN